MKFLIDSAGMLSEPEKRVYKRAKWKQLGVIRYSIYRNNTVYEIEIDSLDELLEMCEDYSRGFSGILIQEISESHRKEMEEAGIHSDAVFEITCYNSWIE